MSKSSAKGEGTSNECATGYATRKSARFDELDAYRGIAALLIVVHHVYLLLRDANGRYLYEGTFPHFLLANLDVGVTWFFALSGFVIFLPYARAAIEGQAAPSSLHFLMRRIVRIVPLYYIVIIVAWMRYSAESPDRQIDLLRHLTFTHVFDARYFYSTIDVAWSLGVEAMFYLFIAAFGPPLCSLCARFADRRSRSVALIGSLVAIGLVSSGYKWWGLQSIGVGQPQPHLFFGPVAQLDTFAAGMMVAAIWAIRRGQAALSGRVRLWLSVGSITILIIALGLRHTGLIAGVYFGAISGVGFALLLANTIFSPSTRWFKRVLLHPGCQFLGLISFSLYLWHRPLLNELSVTPILTTHNALPLYIVGTIGIAVLVAAASYWCIERTTLSLRHRRRPGEWPLTSTPPAATHNMGSD